MAEPAEIGERLRTIRKRRGLSQQVVAELAGIGQSYLSMLERGERFFDRRGLLEDLAAALGCSVTDITGGPQSMLLVPDLSDISVALADATLTDVPDVPARPLDELARLAAEANQLAAQSRYTEASYQLARLLVELHVAALADPAALPALVEAAIVAAGVARSVGNPDLAAVAGERAVQAARASGDPALIAFASMSWGSALSRLGARHRAGRAVDEAFAAVEHADPSARDTAAAEALGMLHLSLAQLAAKAGRADDTTAHLAAAGELAARTGEQNTLEYSFGPANVRAWSLSTAVELGEGARAAAAIADTDPARGLDAADRAAAVHFDLARAWRQHGRSDQDAVRHLDVADRIAPQRIRSDPIARSLVADLLRRATTPSWELRSLANRLGYHTS